MLKRTAAPFSTAWQPAVALALIAHDLRGRNLKKQG